MRATDALWELIGAPIVGIPQHGDMVCPFVTRVCRLFREVQASAGS